MNTDLVLHKYLRQFRLMDGNRYYHIDAIELAFRLALDELDQSTPSTSATELVALQANQLADLQAELERLQTAADAEVAELRQQIAQMDTDNAALIRRNRELVAALDIATGAAPAVAKPVAVHANGAAPSAISNQQSAINNLIALDISGLSSENLDWWIGLQAGRQQWRSIPKRNRLDLVRCVLSHDNDDGAMTMATFDNIRPEWMPTAGTHTKVFNMSWEQLNDFTVELEATR